LPPPLKLVCDNYRSSVLNVLFWSMDILLRLMLLWNACVSFLKINLVRLLLD
jgi:hypothetical protein